MFMQALAFLDECSVFSSDEANVTFIQILGTARLIVKVLQIVIPIALIIWGTIDLGKAVIAGKEDDIKKGRQTFTKRVVAAIIVFLIPFIVNLIMGFVSSGTWHECWEASKNQTIRKSSIITSENY